MSESDQNFSAAYAAGEYQRMTINGSDGEPKIIVVPAHMKALDLSKFDDYPRTIEKNIRMLSMQSLTEYAVEQADPELPAPTLFVHSGGMSVQAIIDSWSYARPTAGRHTVEYQGTTSNEFDTWVDAAEVRFGQDVFCKILRKNRADIVSPSGAELLELVHNLQLSSSARITSAGADGKVTAMSFERTTTAKSRQSAHGEVMIPSSITISIPVIQNDEAKHKIELDMDVTVSEDNRAVFSLSWVVDRDQVKRDAFDSLVAKAVDGKTLTIYEGVGPK